jgi:hypothetical protein
VDAATSNHFRQGGLLLFPQTERNQRAKNANLRLAKIAVHAEK